MQPLRAFLENPLVGRQLTTTLTGVKLAAVFTVVNLTLMAVDAIGFFSFVNEGLTLAHLAGPILHSLHMLALCGLLLVLVPLRVAGALEGPRFHRSFDQIVITGISPLRLHFGNWALGLLYTLAVLVVSLPYECIAYSFGGDLSVRQIIEGYAVLFVYANVLIALTLALSLFEREWLTVPVLIACLVISGCLGVVPEWEVQAFFGPAFSEVTPARLFMRQAAYLGETIDPRTGFVFNLQAEPRLFGVGIPLVVYPYLLWGFIILVCLVPLVLGPGYRFSPGRNNFGTVVLPGDRKRRRLRRLHLVLGRRSEVAFLYRSRPAWCDRWDFWLRCLVDFLVVVFFWGAIQASVHPRGAQVNFGGAMRVLRDAGIMNDDSLMLSFWLGASVLALWILLRVDTRDRIAWTYPIGRWNVPRGVLLGAFLLLFLLLFGWIQYGAVHEALETARENPVRVYTTGDGAVRGTEVSPDTIPAEVFTQRERRWSDLILGVGVFLFNMFLLGRVLGRCCQNGLAARLALIGAGSLLFIGSAFLFFLVIEVGAPRVLLPGAFFSPVVYLIAERHAHMDFALRFHGYLASHAALALLVIAIWALQARRARSLASRAGALARAGAAVLLLIAPLGALGAQEPEAPATSTDAPLLPLDVVEVIRGFGGSLFSDGDDFFTIVLRNTGSDDIDGRFWLQSDGLRSETVEFSVPRGTTRVVRWERAKGGGGLKAIDGKLIFEAHGQSTEFTVDPVAQHVYRYSRARRRRGTQVRHILVCGPDGEPPLAWKRGAVDDEGSTVVAHCKTLGLPQSSASYAGLDLVVVRGDGLADWAPRQQRALYDYVRLGGCVLFCGRFDPAQLATAGAWRELFAGSEPRAGVLEGNDLVLHEFRGGTPQEVTVGADGERYTLLHWVSLGPGRVGHSSIDLVRPRLAAASRPEFWQRLTRELPRGAFPIVLHRRTQEESYLFDSTSLLSVQGHLLLYTIVLAAAVGLLMRGKKASLVRWSCIPLTAGVFSLAVPAVMTFVRSQPSYGAYYEVMYRVSGESTGVVFGQLSLCSSGRQDHSLRVRGAQRLGAFTLGRPYTTFSWSRAFMPFQELESEEGLSQDYRLSVAPWAAAHYLFVGEGLVAGDGLLVSEGSSTGEGAVAATPAARAIYDVKNEVLRIDVPAAGVPDAVSELRVLALALPGRPGALSAKVPMKGPIQGPRRGMLQGTVDLSDAAGNFTHGEHSAASGARNALRFRELPVLIDVAPGGSPRVAVIWREDAARMSLDLSSPEILFERELSEREARSFRPSRWRPGYLERHDGKSFRVQRHRATILELPLTLEGDGS